MCLVNISQTAVSRILVAGCHLERMPAILVVGGLLNCFTEALHATAELENHLGMSEKTLAEFVIELASGKTSAKDFQKALTSNQAEMPESLVHTIWNVIQRLTQVW